ncbi:GSCOCG00011275001-RA-CDS [Cotesia congregata]|nr:GSCOCG00011275001-RA-CDS [Cotesia congregata]
MSDHTEEQLENGGSNGGHTLKRHREEDSSGSSDSERSRALSLPPLLPRKRRRFSDTSREIRALHEKVELLSDLLLQKQNAPEPPVVSMPATAPQTSVLNLGQCKTEVDAKKLVQQADPESLKTLCDLQRFGLPDWKEIRYSNTLKEFLASPGFSELKVNEELCYLDKAKDPVLSTERVLAGLSNAVLTQSSILQNTLQDVADHLRQKSFMHRGKT